MTDILEALREQHAELDAILTPLADAAWATPTPACPGWTIADVVLHMAQTDEAAKHSVEGENLRMIAAEFAENAGRVDDAAAVAVEQNRGIPIDELLARWRAAAAGAREALEACDPSARVQWVAGEMAARTLATTRLSECWIHTGDVAEPLGIERPPAERIWHIARLAWRTLPYAFARADRELSGPVAVLLTAPDGSDWDFVPEDAALTQVSGPALDFCLVAARRRDPADTQLKAIGPDAQAVLELMRTYA